ncbi:uncharacterized protein BDFB_009378, partial [Asbolus verrucosus]
YYWRDYFGEVPDDAVPGGLDRNHKTTYIAQLFVFNNGILTTRLYQGEKSVTASRYGIHTSDVAIKVLCSDKPEKLSWVPTTASKLHTDTIGKHLVVGGTENGKVLNVGRVSYQGEIIVGKVCGYNIGNSLLFFPYQNKEIHADSYEVLVYDDNPVPVFDRIRTFTSHSLPQTGYCSYYSLRLSSEHQSKCPGGILCSPHPEAFEWTSIQSKDLHEYTNRNLIPGGNEVGEKLYIGRVFRDKGAIIGKIFRHERANRGIWFPYGNGPANSLTYEILSYNCENVVKEPEIDVRIKTY